MKRGGIAERPPIGSRRELKVRVDGQFVFNNITLRLNAALAGIGLAYLPEDEVRTYLADARLIRVLTDWCPCFSGYHLYCPTAPRTGSGDVPWSERQKNAPSAGTQAFSVCWCRLS
jgi:DNA-binding transcriptional LysR family regulator